MESLESYIQFTNEIEYLYNSHDRISYCQTLLDSKDNNNESFNEFLNAIILINQCQYDNGIQALNKALAIEPNNPFIKLRIGIAYRAQRLYDNAIEQILPLLKLNDICAISSYYLGSIYLRRNDNKNAIKYLEKAISIDPSIPFSYNALGLVYRNQSIYDKAIESFEKAISLKSNYYLPHINIGSTYRSQGKHTKAIEHLNKVISMFANSPIAYSELGLVFFKKRNYKKAIEILQKAIEIDQYYSRSYLLLGYFYLRIKEYDKAVDPLNNASTLDKYNPLVYTHLGKLYNELHGYKKAIEYFKKSLANKSDNYSTYQILGDIYKKQYEYNLELQLFYDARQVYLKNDYNSYYISLINDRIIDINERIELQKISQNEKEIIKQDLIVKDIFNKIKDHKIDIDVTTARNKSLEFLQSESGPVDQFYFEVLRRWNSYTPIVADSYHTSKGGGYFLKVNDLGIVIDPGFNFIDNFRGRKHKFNEITTVLISHAHNDHTSDLESILTLLHKYNEDLKEEIQNKLAEEKKVSKGAISPKEIETVFSQKRKIIDLYITKSISSKYSGYLKLDSKNSYNVHVIDEGMDYKISDMVSFYTIKAKHNDIISDRDSVGFLFNLNQFDTTLVYTGDTGWSKEMQLEYKKIKKKCLKKMMLIAHIGGFKEYEEKYLTAVEEHKEQFLYTNHLGRIGLIRINETLNPTLCLISEFGEEFRGHRINLTNIYQEIFHEKSKKEKQFKPIRFLPADIGLKYDFTEGKFEAISGINSEDNNLHYDYVEQEHIKACLLRKDYSLHYYDAKANFSEADLIQVIREDFDNSTR